MLMSKGMTLLTVFASALVGAIIGVLLANWRFGGSHFLDPEVLLAARLLFGGGGAMLFGYLASSRLTKRAIHQ
jgi:hypothetical protein